MRCRRDARASFARPSIPILRHDSTRPSRRSLACRLFSCFVAVVCVPAAISTVNGSPRLARADADLHVGRARPPSASASTRRRRIPRRRSPSFGAHPLLLVRRARSSSSTRPPGAVIARRLGDRARRAAARDAVPGRASRRPRTRRASAASRARPSSRSRSSRGARRASARARSSTTSDRSTAIDPRRPAGGFDGQVAFAAAEVGDASAAASADPARATTPPSSGRAPAGARRGCPGRRARRSSPSAAAAPPAAAPRPPAPPDRRPTSSNCACSIGDSADRRRPRVDAASAVVAEAAVALFDDECRRPSAGRDDASTPDCASPSTPVSSVTFEPLPRQHAQQAQPRFVAEQPVERRGVTSHL